MSELVRPRMCSTVFLFLAHATLPAHLLLQLMLRGLKGVFVLVVLAPAGHGAADHVLFQLGQQCDEFIYVRIRARALYKSSAYAHMHTRTSGPGPYSSISVVLRSVEFQTNTMTDEPGCTCKCNVGWRLVCERPSRTHFGSTAPPYLVHDVEIH